MSDVIHNRNPIWEKPEHQAVLIKAYMKLNELRSLMDSTSFLDIISKFIFDQFPAGGMRDADDGIGLPGQAQADFAEIVAKARKNGPGFTPEEMLDMFLHPEKYTDEAIRERKDAYAEGMREASLRLFKMVEDARVKYAKKTGKVVSDTVCDNINRLFWNVLGPELNSCLTLDKVHAVDMMLTRLGLFSDEDIRVIPGAGKIKADIMLLVRDAARAEKGGLPVKG